MSRKDNRKVVKLKKARAERMAGQEGYGGADEEAPEYVGEWSGWPDGYIIRPADESGEREE